MFSQKVVVSSYKRLDAPWRGNRVPSGGSERRRRPHSDDSGDSDDYDRYSSRSYESESEDGSASYPYKDEESYS